MVSLLCLIATSIASASWNNATLNEVRSFETYIEHLTIRADITRLIRIRRHLLLDLNAPDDDEDGHARLARKAKLGTIDVVLDKYQILPCLRIPCN